MVTRKEKQTQGKTAYEYLRISLLHAKLPLGSRLREVEWSQRIGVSRGALREAMNLLSHEGLLKAGERGGFFVPNLDQRDMNEIIELRLTLELGALSLLPKCKNAQQQVSEMRALCDLMSDMIDNDLALGYAEVDSKFHTMLIDAAGNSRISRVYHHSPIPLFMPMKPIKVVEYLKSSLSEHKKLCQLLEESKWDDAAILLKKHLMTAYVPQ